MNEQKYDLFLVYSQSDSTRVQQLASELSDAGIQITFFTGNHDMWMQGYFEQEIGAEVYRKPLQLIVNNERPTSHLFYIAHGDGLGPGDYGYKLLKILFESRFCRWAFGWLGNRMIRDE